jgi:eukaryotic-like serine/threonine-protein kinase
VTGKTIAHYDVLEKLGEGGMGVVYKARDTRLDRIVALKALPQTRVASPEQAERLVREAQAASALNHPNIVTIHDLVYEDGSSFIVMEYVEGKPLADLIGEDGLEFNTATNYAAQLADALAAAHAAGIIHRDLKPGNIMVTPGGRVKVLDFGLAKREAPPLDPDTGPTRTALPSDPITKEGVILGTIAYMSPEQVEGKQLAPSSDIFSFGAVLYEMVTGQRAFRGDSAISTMSAILRDRPAPVRELRPKAPREIDRIVRRCLEKNPEPRPAASELAAELRGPEERAAADLPLRRLALAALILVAIAAVVALLYQRHQKVRWANEAGIAEIEDLIGKQDFTAAFATALEVERYAPDNAALAELWPRVSRQIAFRTDPPGADIYVRENLDVDGEWRLLGQSPIDGVRVPSLFYRWRITKPGYRQVEVADPSGPLWGSRQDDVEFKLHEDGSIPQEMVFVPAGSVNWLTFGMTQGRKDVGEFLLDRCEVTNPQYKQFIDAGGYQKPDYWKHEFVKEGRPLTWDQAMDEFVDETGRHGPATWSLGSYPEGQEDYPVRGVSWYEAAAYAEFSGKRLPTIHHWKSAARPGVASFVIPLANFGGQGPIPVGSSTVVSPAGAFDMAGNVKEWTWNASGDERFVLGGSWNEPTYMFGYPDTRRPFNRSAEIGFRCYRPIDEPSASLAEPVVRTERDYTAEKPVSDDVFRIYLSQYAYDRAPLNPEVELFDDGSRYWSRERATFDAAYGGERMIANILLPKDGRPPFQAVIYFPGQGQFRRTTSENLAGLEHIELFLRSGRAVVYPMYEGCAERPRPEGAPTGHVAFRDTIIRRTKDLCRTIDYLETRDDIDATKLAFQGVSLGAVHGPIFLAVEQRLVTGILANGGLLGSPLLPEADPLNHAPRVRQPVLMVNGSFDFLFPLDSSQQPLFDLLDTTEKRHLVSDRGHGSFVYANDEIRVVLDWLDKHLGPVN